MRRVLNRDVEFTWLGHSTFKIRTPGGKTVLLEPWVMGNPACPDDQKRLTRVDLMLITHGHNDHMGDAVALGRQLRPGRVVAIYEICQFLESKGVANCSGMNKGGTQEADGIKVTMVDARHSSGILDRDQMVPGGESAAFVVELENGFRFYHAGDTSLFGDMRLIGELYRPDVALLPIGDHYTMGPREAARAAQMLGVTRVVPIHYGTFPVLTGTPQALREAAPSLEVLELRPGETLS